MNSQYKALCESATIEPVTKPIDLNHFLTPSDIASNTVATRMTAALQVLLDLYLSSDHPSDNVSERVDKVLIDDLICKLDQKISEQLDEIVHHSDFQDLESLWLGLEYVVQQTDPQSKVKLEILNIDKQDLIEDFDEASDVTESVLYKHVYVDEYDTPGGEPFTAMITPFAFGNEPQSIKLMRDLVKVASSAHCPCIAGVTPQFFFKGSFNEVNKIEDMTNYLQRAEYLEWNSFRDSEDARYLGLVLPRFLLRLPYGGDNPVRGFQYQERVSSDHEQYLWGSSSFAFAANLVRSFRDHGWCVNIRGPESGGKVEELLIPPMIQEASLIRQIPTEILISETREFELSDLGFIPLSYYKNSDNACFFSANSAQKPAIYSTDEATANARINARLPYIFLVSRIAHYLKVLQRENIGAHKNQSDLEDELNDWLGTLVTTMNNPSSDIIAKHPLREAFVEVNSSVADPGYYSVNLYVVPHFQIEGMDVRLALVSEFSDKNI